MAKANKTLTFSAISWCARMCKVHSERLSSIFFFCSSSLIVSQQSPNSRGEANTPFLAGRCCLIFTPGTIIDPRHVEIIRSLADCYEHPTDRQTTLYSKNTYGGGRETREPAKRSSKINRPKNGGGLFISFISPMGGLHKVGFVPAALKRLHTREQELKEKH